MDNNKEYLCYQNEYYKVVCVAEEARRLTKDAEGADVEANFEVRNRKYETVEFYSNNLPNAMNVASHFNQVLRDYDQGVEEDVLMVDLTNINDGGLLN